MRLNGHGLGIELPRGWSGRVFSRTGSAATLHVASFPLPLGDGEFGDSSTAHMHADAVLRADGVPSRARGWSRAGACSAPRNWIPRRLDPSAFSAAGLAHPRPGQAGMQHFFTSSRRPFCLYVVLAGPRTGRRRQLAEVDHVLSSLQIAARP